MAEKAEITRKEIIVVDKVSHNDYGDLVFTDKTGKSFKVKEARSQYFTDVIIEGRAAELSYSSYKGREYVYSAKLVELPKDEPATPQSTPVVSKPSNSPDLHNRSYALSYAKDMAVAKVIEPKDVLSYAITFADWMDGKPQAPITKKQASKPVKEEEPDPGDLPF